MYQQKKHCLLCHMQFPGYSLHQRILHSLYFFPPLLVSIFGEADTTGYFEPLLYILTSAVNTSKCEDLSTFAPQPCSFHSAGQIECVYVVLSSAVGRIEGVQ